MLLLLLLTLRTPKQLHHCLLTDVSASMSAALAHDLCYVAASTPGSCLFT
jgi:uncharacterized protein with von Willebrand factor type A (vWA) domain